MRKVSTNAREVKLNTDVGLTSSTAQAEALEDIEPRLRRIKGYRFLPVLRLALRKHLNLDHDAQEAFAAD